MKNEINIDPDRKPKNPHQEWLFEQGYRRTKSGCWVKDNLVVTGKELSDKLDEWQSEQQRPQEKDYYVFTIGCFGEEDLVWDEASYNEAVTKWAQEK